MGILNLTPDSFSDGGKFIKKDDALFHVEEMIRDGASIIDVGGESTRPGAETVSPEEEIMRVIPVIEVIRERFDAMISLDTYKAATAREGIRAGADIINDIGGLSLDEDMAKVIASSRVRYVLTHNRIPESERSGSRVNLLPGEKKGTGSFGETEHAGTESEISYVNQFKEEASALITFAKEAGIAEERIIFDPGIGFHKTYAQDLALLRHMDELTKFGLPVLLGVSRKSVIGMSLDLPVSERLEGTLAVTALAFLKGIDFIRVHDVKENVRLLKMLRALWE